MSKTVKTAGRFALILALACGIATAALPRTARSSAGDPPASLADYWTGTANWRLYARYTVAGSDATTPTPFSHPHGTFIRTHGSSWFLFQRNYMFVDADDPCYAVLRVRLGMTVRQSQDRGRSWTAPIDVVTPDTDTPWECGATDGDAYYDEADQVWHLMFQCISRDAIWHGCHLSREAESPLGAFTANHANPSFSAAQAMDILTALCSNPSKACWQLARGRPMRDPGTFNIIERRDGYFYVSFHAIVVETQETMRFLARTSDFITWIVELPDSTIPNDAMIAPRNGIAWRETWNSGGPVAVGSAGTVFQDNHYYTVADLQDSSALCVPNQTVDSGIFRSRTLADNTNQLQGFPRGNPVLYSSRALEVSSGNYRAIPSRIISLSLRSSSTQPPDSSYPCNQGYARIFIDATSGEVFLVNTRISSDDYLTGAYVYRLEKEVNLLPNSTFWTCTSAPWNVYGIPGDQFPQAEPVRDPKVSTEADCSVRITCPSQCRLDEGIYQDVAQTWSEPSLVEFGAKAFSAFGGTLRIVLQPSSRGSPVGEPSIITGSLGPSFQQLRGQIVLPTNTSRLRLVLNPIDVLSVYVDEVFVTRRPIAAASPSPTAPTAGGVRVSASPVASQIHALPARTAVTSPGSTPVPTPQPTPTPTPPWYDPNNNALPGSDSVRHGQPSSTLSRPERRP
ncbi:MAG: hypothetical protein U0821_12890 [Chloroflexota bacterium]